jgi:hypothetical protein
LLAKHFSNVSAASTSSSNKTAAFFASAPKRKVPTDPKKLAQFQKVEFMKMRHRAVPADPRDKPGSIGIEQRLHVRVSCEGDPEAAQKVFWFRKVSRGHVNFFLRRVFRFSVTLTFLSIKTVGTGRALDMLARHFNAQATTVSTTHSFVSIFLFTAFKAITSVSTQNGQPGRVNSIRNGSTSPRAD